MTAVPVQTATGDWVADALCAEVGGDLWHPDKGGSTTAAKAVCARCPVQRPCLRWAVETGARDGVLGGLSPRERYRLTLVDIDAMPPVEAVDVVIPAGRPIPGPVVPLVRPRPIPEPRPVPELDDQAPAEVVVPEPAPAGFEVFERPRKTRAKVAVCGTTGGYSRHKKAKEPACEPCKEANRVYQKAWYQAKHAVQEPKPEPQPEAKPHLQVLWLLPAMSGPGHLEYAVDDGKRWAPVGADTAAVLMAQGEAVHCRQVTDWQPVVGGVR